MLRRPIRFLRALRLAFKMARGSDRPLGYHLVYLAEACCTLSWLSSFGASWIHAHFGTNSTDITMLVHVLGGPRFSFTAHGPEEFLRPVGLGEKIRRAAFVVAISSFGRSQLCLWAGPQDWHKIQIVHCGLERSFYEGTPSAPQTARRLVCVGRLATEKGQLGRNLAMNFVLQPPELNSARIYAGAGLGPVARDIGGKPLRGSAYKRTDCAGRARRGIRLAAAALVEGKDR